ncbi:MAG: DUF1385 domain-containing protein [Negativicutes bacterium]|jgi:uncharacterized protein YqhQ|nr:DUF1385 domain-containing protein [Negativicutes bacterium]
MGKNIQKVGGQAVLEGVMMRAGDHMAIAVRNLQGEISVETEEIDSWGKRWPILKWPLLRGAAGMIESMKIGAKALHFSAVVLGEEEEGGESGWLSTLMMGLGFLLALGLFVALPSVATRFLAPEGLPSWQLSVIEGLMKVFIFLAYLVGISQLKDIRRVFEYHGAEHKTIYAYENGKELTVENVKPYTRLHPRCGTNFLFLVVMVSIIVSAFVTWSSLPERILWRIGLLPLVAGLAYELIRLGGSSDHWFIKMIMFPGLMLQNLTTREPDESQIEVAIVSLENALSGSSEKVEESELPLIS